MSYVPVSFHMSNTKIPTSLTRGIMHGGGIALLVPRGIA